MYDLTLRNKGHWILCFFNTFHLFWLTDLLDIHFYTDLFCFMTFLFSVTKYIDKSLCCAFCTMVIIFLMLALLWRFYVYVLLIKIVWKHSLHTLAFFSFCSTTFSSNFLFFLERSLTGAAFLSRSFLVDRFADGKTKALLESYFPVPPNSTLIWNKDENYWMYMSLNTTMRKADTAATAAASTAWQHRVSHVGWGGVTLTEEKNWQNALVW